jgi:hypothetical protein
MRNGLPASIPKQAARSTELYFPFGFGFGCGLSGV